MKKGKKEEKLKTILVEAQDVEFLTLSLRVIIEEKKASTSLLQRRLKIGYASSARLMDKLVDIKAVGPAPAHTPTGKSFIFKALPIPEPAKEPVEKKKMGRPTKYTEAIIDEICKRMALGESVRQICRSDHMPERQTVYGWLLDPRYEDFMKRYEQARILQADAIHDELFDIADDGSNDWIEREIGEGRTITVPDHEYINRSRLRVDTRKWIIARMNPKKYGEKLDVTTGGKEIKQARPAIINYIIPKELKIA